MSSVNNTRIIELLNLLKAGEREAFDEFYELTKRPIYYSIFALVKDDATSEDLLQETYIRFLNNLKRLKKNKNPLGYLLVTSRNLTYDYFKKENRVSSLEDYENEYEIGAAIEENFDDSERLLSRMQQLLNETEYEIVTLYILGELTHKEIAQQLNKPLGTVTWAYSNAIKKLQKGLSDYE